MGLTEKHWFEDDYIEVRRGDLEQLQNDEPIYAVSLLGNHFFNFYFIKGKENAIRFMKQNLYSNGMLRLSYARLYKTSFSELGVLISTGDPILVMSKE